MVSAGNYSGVLLRSDGKVAIAGSQEIMGEYNLVREQQRGKFKQVSAGSGHTLLLTKGGKIVQLGKHGEKLGAPLAHFPDHKYAQVSAGHNHSVALRTDGKVVNVGMRHTSPESQATVQVQEGDGKVCVQVSAGSSHTAHLYGDGTVDALGNNEQGQCNLPQEAGYSQVSAGGAHTVLLSAEGKATAHGSNKFGQCQLPQSPRYKKVSAGLRHTVLLSKDGDVKAVGSNEDGQCDIPDLESGVEYVQASAGGHLTMLLRSDGQAVMVGHQGGTSIPAVKKLQSYSDWMMSRPVLPEGVQYVADTEETPIWEIAKAQGSSRAVQK